MAYPLKQSATVLFVQPRGSCEVLGLVDAFPTQRLADWRETIAALSIRAPLAIVGCGLTIDDAKTNVIRSCAARGLLPPTIMCWVCGRREDIGRACALAPIVDFAVSEKDAISKCLEDLCNEGSGASVAKCIVGQTRMSTSASHSLIRLFASDARSLKWKVKVVAEHLGIGKSALYEALNRDGLPGVSHLQMLFRLVAAARLIQRGASTADAAYCAGLTEARSLRRALRRHLDVSVVEVRDKPNYRWMVERWIERHVHVPPRT